MLTTADTDKLAEIREWLYGGRHWPARELLAAYIKDLLRAIDEMQSAPSRIPEGYWLAPWEPDISMMSAGMDVHNRDGRAAIGGGRITDIYAAARDAYLAAHPECGPEGYAMEGP